MRRHAGILIPGFIMTCVMAGSVAAETGYYGGIRLGSSSMQQGGIEAVNPRVTGISGGKNKDSASTFGLAVGRKFENAPVRLDLEWTERGKASLRVDTIGNSGGVFTGANKLSVKARSLMLNGFWDVPVKSVSLFVSGGLGVSRISADGSQTFQVPPFTAPPAFGTTFLLKSNTQLAWSVGAGASYPLGKTTAIDLAYRYIDLGKYSTGTDTVNRDERFGARLRANEISLGLRFGF